MDSRAEISNSRITASGHVHPVTSWAGALYSSYGAYTIVRNSVIEASAADYVYGVAESAYMEISGSVIRATDGVRETRTAGVKSIINSEIRATSSTGTLKAVDGGSVASSLIDGPLNIGATLVNCWGETFTPIPNQ